MNGFKNWSVIPARTWRIRQADEGDGWLKIPAIPIPVGELTPARRPERGHPARSCQGAGSSCGGACNGSSQGRRGHRSGRGAQG